MAFPSTRYSVVEALGAADGQTRARAFEAVVLGYWKPVYKHLRLRWGARPEDAEDLTQGFFARCLEKGLLDHYDASRARFRTFLRICLDGFVGNERKSASRLKRGGGARTFSLDFPGAESEIAAGPSAAASPKEQFQREWARALFAGAVDELRERCRAAGRKTQFQLFERYDLEPGEGIERPSYASLAAELGLSVTQVTNALFAARREFRKVVLERLRALTGSEEEYRSEARQLIGPAFSDVEKRR